MRSSELLLSLIAANLTLVGVAFIAAGAVNASWWQPALGGLILTLAEFVRIIARDIGCRTVCYTRTEREEPT